VNFYQSSFGPAALIEVHQPSGQEIFRDAVALSSSAQISGYMLHSGSFDLTDLDLSVQLVGSEVSDANPAEIGDELAIQVKKNNSTTTPVMDIIQKGTPRDIAGLQFTYVEGTQYSGFQVSRDPGTTLIWIAAAIFLVGLVIVLYFSYRRLWVQVQDQHGTTRIRMRLVNPRSQESDAELIKLKKGIEQRASRKSMRIQ
jgi:cytochrome c biogenesis protein ResB